MTDQTAKALVDWCYAALTAVGLKGRRVVIFGHDSMGMETALAHVIPTRRTFGLEITRLDMKLLADMLAKKAYDDKELKALRGWIDKHVGKRLELRSEADSERFNQSLAMYLIVRDLLADLNAVGGGFMSQLEWGSDPRGMPLPVADVMESLFNSTFDHNGRKPAMPFATEADVQGLLTMLVHDLAVAAAIRRCSWTSARCGSRGRSRSWPRSSGVRKLDTSADWGDRRASSTATTPAPPAFDWAGRPGATVKQIMERVSMPLADLGYFPGGGNSVTFITPGGIEGIAARMAYSSVSGMFSLVWDEAETTELPEELGKAMCNLTNPTWPHTFVVPKYATMAEYKQYAPANHFHMTWDLPVARLQYWMDLTGVLSVTPWAARPKFIEGVDRPQPLLHLINGGEEAYKLLGAVADRRDRLKHARSCRIPPMAGFLMREGASGALAGRLPSPQFGMRNPEIPALVPTKNLPRIYTDVELSCPITVQGQVYQIG